MSRKVVELYSTLKHSLMIIHADCQYPLSFFHMAKNVKKGKDDKNVEVEDGVCFPLINGKISTIATGKQMWYNCDHFAHINKRVLFDPQAKRFSLPALRAWTRRSPRRLPLRKTGETLTRSSRLMYSSAAPAMKQVLLASYLLRQALSVLVYECLYNVNVQRQFRLPTLVLRTATKTSAF